MFPSSDMSNTKAPYMLKGSLNIQCSCELEITPVIFGDIHVAQLFSMLECNPHFMFCHGIVQTISTKAIMVTVWLLT